MGNEIYESPSKRVKTREKGDESVQGSPTKRSSAQGANSGAIDEQDRISDDGMMEDEDGNPGTIDLTMAEDEINGMIHQYELDGIGRDEDAASDDIEVEEDVRHRRRELALGERTHAEGKTHVFDKPNADPNDNFVSGTLGLPWAGMAGFEDEDDIFKELGIDEADGKPGKFDILPKTWQFAAMAWVLQKERNLLDVGGVLAGIMGLGKTLVSLTGPLVEDLQVEGVLNRITLIIVKSSLVDQWMNEIRKYSAWGYKRAAKVCNTGDLIYCLENKKRILVVSANTLSNVKNAEMFEKAAVQTLQRLGDYTSLKEVDPLEGGDINRWEVGKKKGLRFAPYRVTLDEAHNFKADQAGFVLRSMRVAMWAKKKWLLSATLVINGLADLYNPCMLLKAEVPGLGMIAPKRDGQLEFKRYTNRLSKTGDDVQRQDAQDNFRSKSIFHIGYMLRRDYVDVGKPEPWRTPTDQWKQYLQPKANVDKILKMVYRKTGAIIAKDIENDPAAADKKMSGGLPAFKFVTALRVHQNIYYRLHCTELCACSVHFVGSNNGAG